MSFSSLDTVKTDYTLAVRVLGKHLLLKGMIPEQRQSFKANEIQCRGILQEAAVQSDLRGYWN
jgi:hypothetical protein